MRAVVRSALLALAVALPLASLVGWLVDGWDGVFGALLGLLLPALFLGVTVAVALLTARRSPQVMGAAIVFSWLVKMVVLIAVMSLLGGLDGWSRSVFTVTFLLGVAGWLLGEAYVVTRSRVTYVD
jgi:chromate transport protein ChrA